MNLISYYIVGGAVCQHYKQRDCLHYARRCAAHWRSV